MDKNKSDFEYHEADYEHHEATYVKAEEKSVWDGKVISSFSVALAFLAVGFFQVWVYTNSELGESINVHVGGDAYNYIINATQGTAYFVVALCFTVLGCTFYLANHIHKMAGKL